MTFDDPTALHAWLIAQGLDLSAWGHGAAKDAAALWTELREGDARLVGPPPLRLVEVVEVLVAHPAAHHTPQPRYLIEAEQELGDGRRRQRNLLPSEKLKPGEDCQQAAIRCLQEELGVAPQDVEIIPGSQQVIQRTLDSPSYPGLPTRYTVHTVAARVQGLPAESFWTSEATSNPHDPVKRHSWVWQPYPHPGESPTP
jgi:ADP-ribose pyrophosphatase YjhB (NUDIX family)